MKYAFTVQFHYFNAASTLCHIKSDPLPPHFSFKLCGTRVCSCSGQMWIRSRVDDEPSQQVLVFVFA